MCNSLCYSFNAAGNWDLRGAVVQISRACCHSYMPILFMVKLCAKLT